MYNKFQFILLEMVRTKTLTKISKQYFDDKGLGYLQKVMAGKAEPHRFMLKGILKKVPKKWHKKYDEYVAYEKSFKGW